MKASDRARTIGGVLPTGRTGRALGFPIAARGPTGRSTNGTKTIATTGTGGMAVRGISGPTEIRSLSQGEMSAPRERRSRDFRRS